MKERSRRKPEQAETAASLLDQFQKTLTGMPEFRQAITKKYFAEPANATEKDVNTVIGKFFSKDPQRSISKKNYIPGVAFEKDDYQFNVNYSSQTRQLTILRKNDESFQLISIATGRDTRRGTIWNAEDPYSINLDQEEARAKAQELLTSLKSK